MPSQSLYLVVRTFPRRLLYANGAVELECAENSRAACFKWEFRARKLNRAGETCVITAHVSRYRLEHQMRHEGFGCEHGTPAAKIMDRLVHEGYAVKASARGRF